MKPAVFAAALKSIEYVVGVPVVAVYATGTVVAPTHADGVRSVMVMVGLGLMVIVTGDKALTQPVSELITCTVALYVPGAAAAGTVKVIDPAGSAVAGTSTKPAVCARTSKSTMYWLGAPTGALYARVAVVVPAHTSGTGVHVTPGVGLIVTVTGSEGLPHPVVVFVIVSMALYVPATAAAGMVIDMGDAGKV